MRDDEREASRTSRTLRASSFQSTRAKKSLGQNFLVDERIVERIIRAFEPRADEIVVEIGPGRGVMTSRLVERAGRVVAVELDRDLIPLLRERFDGKDNFTLIEADALEADFCRLIAPSKSARVVANLPYYISTAILQRLIEQRDCLTEMILMLQREVVDRITAPAGTSERGYLSVLVEAYTSAEKLFDVSPEAFRPVPKVWSSVARLSVNVNEAVKGIDESVLWRTVSAGFAQRRKTILNNLRHAPGELASLVEGAGGAACVLEGASIETNRRAETLSLHEWARLSHIIKSASGEN
jgi:16S rRNA (adenine1518-N6/adenine1519-N6)-dimethyltransferase